MGSGVVVLLSADEMLDVVNRAVVTIIGPPKASLMVCGDDEVVPKNPPKVAQARLGKKFPSVLLSENFYLLKGGGRAERGGVIPRGKCRPPGLHTLILYPDSVALKVSRIVSG